MKTYQIYGLVDPRTNLVGYVGKTFQGLDVRLKQHYYAHAEKPSKRIKWLQELRRNGLYPTIVLLEEVVKDDWHTAEQRWIDHFRGLGQALYNSATAGGGGTRSHVITWTPELDARLGIEVDAVIADDLGVTRKSVTYRRNQLGISASFDRTRNTPPPPMGGWNKLDLPHTLINRLGTKPDYILGQEFGVSKYTVARARRLRDIPSYAETTSNSGQYRKGNFPARWLNQTS